LIVVATCCLGVALATNRRHDQLALAFAGGSAALTSAARSAAFTFLGNRLRSARPLVAISVVMAAFSASAELHGPESVIERFE